MQAQETEAGAPFITSDEVEYDTMLVELRYLDVNMWLISRSGEGGVMKQNSAEMGLDQHPKLSQHYQAQKHGEGLPIWLLTPQAHFVALPASVLALTFCMKPTSVPKILFGTTWQNTV